jgi:hypothetical protein
MAEARACNWSTSGWSTLGKHLGDHTALFGDAQAALLAKGFDVDLLVHGR